LFFYKKLSLKTNHSNLPPLKFQIHFRIRIFTVDDVVKDHNKIMSSIKFIKKIN
jgi:hypothetical protein